jgi:uncharacterized protein (DUF1697 family)
MQTYITLLRGINVSGHHIIKMDALRSLFQLMGFENIRTYIQSGNIVYKGKSIEIDQLNRQIAQEIEKVFGFSIHVQTFTNTQFQNILQGNPFIADGEKDTAFMHVMFVNQAPSNLKLDNIYSKQRHGEEIAIQNEAVYLYLPKGSGDSKWSNTFLENQLKVQATTRNWKTCQQLLLLAEEAK